MRLLHCLDALAVLQLLHLMNLLQLLQTVLELPHEVTGAEHYQLALARLADRCEFDLGLHLEGYQLFERLLMRTTFNSSIDTAIAVACGSFKVVGCS